MPFLAASSSITLVASGDSTLTIQNPGGYARVELPVGTKLWEGGQASATINIPGGSCQLTTITGGAFYELTTDARSGTLSAAEVAATQALVSGGGIPPNMRRVLAFGTSITNKWLDPNVEGSLRVTGGSAYLFWLQAALQGGMSSIINKGVSGNTTTQMVARFAADVAANYASFDTLIFEPGPNDYPNSLSLATVQSNVNSVIAPVLAAGKSVILLTPTPTEFNTSAQNAVQQAVRQWMLTNYAAVAGVTVVDVAALMADPLTGQPLSALYVPTTVEATRVHPSLAGAQVMGRAIAEALPPSTYSPRFRGLGSRDHEELLANSRLQGSNAASARNFFAGAGITVTGGPDSSGISIISGTFAAVTIAPVTGTGTELRSVSGGTRITFGAAGSARSRVHFRVGSGDAIVGGTQWGRWDLAFANATYVVGDHATVGASPLGILTCLVGGATGTASVTPPAAYGDTVTVGATTWLWQRRPAVGDVLVPEIEYEIEAQSGGFCMFGYAGLYRTIDGTVGERWGDSQFGAFDTGATITEGLPGLWMPRRGVLRGLPITLVDPGVTMRHVYVDLRMVLDNAATAIVRIDRVSMRRVSP